jgi:hypothetical protein
MEQDDRMLRSPVDYAQELTRRILLFIPLFKQKQRMRQLDGPPTPTGTALAPKRAMDGKHRKRFSRRWPLAVVAGLTGLVLGAAATFLTTGARLQRLIADRDARIVQLTGQVVQARTEQRGVPALRAVLDQRGRDLNQRVAALDQRGRDLDQREVELSRRMAALDQRERNLARRHEAVPSRHALPSSARPVRGKLNRDILDHLGQHIRTIVDEAMAGH